MATALTSWESEIYPDIDGLPLPALENAVRNACIRFCERTLLWAEDLDRIDVVADQQAYDLTVPAAIDGTIICVENVKYKQDGEDDDQFTILHPISRNQKDLHDTASWIYRTSPTPSAYFVDAANPTKILLYNIPEDASTEGLLVRAAFRPTRTCTTVPDFLHDDYFFTITAGAKADLLNRKAMPWYDPQIAVSLRLDFENSCDNAYLSKIAGKTRRKLEVRLRDIP